MMSLFRIILGDFELDEMLKIDYSATVRATICM